MTKPITYLREIQYQLTLKKMLNLSSGEWGVVCPCGIGDTYFVCAIADAVLKTHGGEYFSVIVKPSHADIPKMFPESIHRTIILPNPNTRLIAKLSKFQPGFPMVGHPGYIGKGELLKILGYKDIHLVDLYRVLFRLPSKAGLSLPKVNPEARDDAMHRFRQLSLPEGKTVIIAPETVSLKAVDKKFWVLLAAELVNAGWTVCTNVLPGQEPLPETIPLSFPIREAIPMAEMAGWVISARSGFCDLISSAHSKLTIIYQNEMWYAGTSYASCSLSHMGLSNKAQEIVISDQSEFGRVIREIRNMN